MFIIATSIFTTLFVHAASLLGVVLSVFFTKQVDLTEVVGLLLPSSCHQISVFHLSTHFFAILLNLLRSSNEQGCARRVHCIMCAVFSVARPHLQVVSPSYYRHLCLCSLLHVNPVRSRFRHLHVKSFG